MTIDPVEKKKMLMVPLCSERILANLSWVGITQLAHLKGKNAKNLMQEINEKAGHRSLAGPMDLMALTNLIDTANKKPL